MAPNHSGGSIFGPMGPYWVKKMGQNRKKLPCPIIRIFDYLAVIDFSQKMEVTVMAPNHGRDPLRSILGPIVPCPKIRIFDYPAVIDFSEKKWKLRLWRQIMVGNP